MKYQAYLAVTMLFALFDVAQLQGQVRLLLGVLKKMEKHSLNQA